MFCKHVLKVKSMQLGNKGGENANLNINWAN
jgi:hypothetical protein